MSVSPLPMKVLGLVADKSQQYQIDLLTVTAIMYHTELVYGTSHRPIERPPLSWIAPPAGQRGNTGI